MIVASVEPSVWSKRRWLLVVVIVMSAQVGLIFWLSGRDPVQRAPERVQSVFVPADRMGLARGLSDPTLFVLPNLHGFSGPAWIKGQPLEQPSLEWTENPRWLTQEAARLGRDFCAFVSTNVTTAFELVRDSTPDLSPAMPELLTGRTPTQSTIRIEGELANRPLVSPLLITSQAAPDSVLASSEVAIGVKPDGTVFSAKLAKSCGSKGVDNEAVRLARMARFESLPASFARRIPDALNWGTLVFQWQTIALATNSVGAGP